MTTHKKINLIFVPFFFVVYKELRRFVRVAGETVIGPVLATGLYIVVFGLALGDHIDLKMGVPYMAFLIPGLIMMSCLNHSLHGTVAAFVTAKYTGEVEDYKMLPINTYQLLGGLVVGGLFRGIVVSVLNLLVGELAYYALYKEFIVLHSVTLLIVFSFLGGVSFSFFGAAMGIYAKSYEVISAISNFILTPLVFLGGVFFSTQNFPPFWKFISEMNPILYMINGFRYSFLGFSDVDIGFSIVVSFSFMIFFGILAVVALKKSNFQRW